VKSYLDDLPKIAALSQQQTQTLNIAANHQKTPVEVDATQAAIDIDLVFKGKQNG
jgi:hypothetical protein